MKRWALLALLGGMIACDMSDRPSEPARSALEFIDFVAPPAKVAR